MSDEHIHSVVRQFPVGQGGLLIGDVTCHEGPGVDRRFSYGFDCGSVNREHFEQGMAMCSAGRLDLLFVSHLDADHVNGIDALAAKMQIDAIVLPCLDALHLVSIACEAIAEGGVRGSVASFVRDPGTWLSERGIRRVYQVQRSDGGDPTPPFQPLLDLRGPDRMTVSSDNEGRLAYAVRHSGAAPPVARVGVAVDVTVLADDASFHLLTQGPGTSRTAASWVLVPYVHPFDDAAVAAFRRAARDVLAIPDDRAPAPSRFAKRLLAVLSDEDKRRELKACYGILSTDGNKPSMSLYAGPDRGGNVETRRTLGGHDRRSSVFDRRIDRSGAWLSTGDANLGGRRTMEAWVRRYEHVFDSVDVFVLPHHGSNRNLHDDVIRRMPRATMVACADSRREHHPHPLLRGRLQMFGHDIAQVSENPFSAFALEVTLPLA